jgi:hypothetical protein
MSQLSKVYLILLLIFCVALQGCQTEYKEIKLAIINLPPDRLVSKSQQTSSGVTSKINTLLNLQLSTKERLELMLDLDEQLKYQFEAYRNDKSNVNFEKMVKKLHEITVSRDITVKIKIKTIIPGATVQYRTQANKDEITANNPTNDCYVNFYIGDYFIWTVRNDIKTANPKKFLILQPDSITIIE